jgi:drug/metabolite transporter (DMT)-like permease
VYWGRRTGWKNLDEVVRAVGTIAVSVGMILLLQGWGGSGIGVVLLILALFCFVLAFVLGRNVDALDATRHRDPDDEE